MDSLLGLGVMKVGVPGMMPCSMERMVLRRPEIPAAGSEWPMLLLTCSEVSDYPSNFHVPESNFSGERRTEPMIKGSSNVRLPEKTEATPPTSVGSPACIAREVSP